MIEYTRRGRYKMCDLYYQISTVSNLIDALSLHDLGFQCLLHISTTLHLPSHVLFHTSQDETQCNMALSDRSLDEDNLLQYALPLDAVSNFLSNPPLLTQICLCGRLTFFSSVWFFPQFFKFTSKLNFTGQRVMWTITSAIWSAQDEASERKMSKDTSIIKDRWWTQSTNKHYGLSTDRGIGLHCSWWPTQCQRLWLIFF